MLRNLLKRALRGRPVPTPPEVLEAAAAFVALEEKYGRHPEAVIQQLVAEKVSIITDKDDPLVELAELQKFNTRLKGIQKEQTEQHHQVECELRTVLRKMEDKLRMIELQALEPEAPDGTRSPAPLFPGFTRKNLELVYQERGRQDLQWGCQDHPDGTGSKVDKWDAVQKTEACQMAFKSGNGTWLHILSEEVAEVLAESDPRLLGEELIQVAAVCVAWKEKLDRAALMPDGRPVPPDDAVPGSDDAPRDPSTREPEEVEHPFQPTPEDLDEYDKMAAKVAEETSW